MASHSIECVTSKASVLETFQLRPNAKLQPNVITLIRIYTVCVHVQHKGCQCMVDACVCVHVTACLGVGEAYCDCSELL